MSLERFSHPFSRRDFLKGLGTFGAIAVASQIPDMKTKDAEITPFPIGKVGWNINVVGLRNSPPDSTFVFRGNLSPKTRKFYLVGNSEPWTNLL